MPTPARKQPMVEIGLREEAELFAQAVATAGMILGERAVDCTVNVDFKDGRLDMRKPHLNDMDIRVQGVGRQSSQEFVLRAFREPQAIGVNLREESHVPDGGSRVLDTSLVQGTTGLRQVVKEILDDGGSRKKDDKPAVLDDVIPEWLQKVRENSNRLAEDESDPSLEFVGRGSGFVMVKQESLVRTIANLLRVAGGVLGNGTPAEMSTVGRLNLGMSSWGRIYPGYEQGLAFGAIDLARKRRADFSLGLRCGAVGPPHAFVESSLRQEDLSSGQPVVTKETLRRKDENTLEVILERREGQGEIVQDGTRTVENGILLDMANKVVTLATRADMWEY